MSYFQKNPRARRAYYAKWRDLWKNRLESGAYAPEEEEAERKGLLLEIADVDSSNKLTEEQCAAVMLAMDAELGPDARSKFKDPARARKIAKIEHLARALRPDNPESYIVAIAEQKFRLSHPDKWRTGLGRNDVHMLMLDLVEQDRRNKRKEKAK